jgi:membrane dipeptidase
MWLAAAVLLVGCDPAPTPAVTTSSVTAPIAGASATPVTAAERAQALAKKFIIVDGHVDLPHRLWEQKQRDNPAEPCPEGNFDYPRAKQGGLDAPFMSIYIPAKHQSEGGAKKLADELIDLVEGIAKASPDKFGMAHSVADVRRLFGEGKIALPMGIENGAAIEGKLENLKHFYDRGVRYITLTHSKDNDICDSSYDERHSAKGLTPFGREVVAEMNRLGVMIDVSHVSDDAFWQVIELTKVAVIASHSSLRHFTPGFERNMSDDMVKALAKNGGVVMINFGSSFIDEAARAKRHDAWKAREAFMNERKIDDHGDPQVKRFNEAYEKEHALPFATVEQVADHVMRTIELAGVDHVGLGSDFDGVGDSLPTGLKDAAQLPNLIRVLIERGLDEAAIEKIASGNVLRVWSAVERHAAASIP